jgi:uncharacterized coiled-coil DUF342 family protein
MAQTKERLSAQLTKQNGTALQRAKELRAELSNSADSFRQKTDDLSKALEDGRARADRHKQSIDHLKQAIGETKRTIASFQGAVDASNRGFVKRMDQLSASFDELRAQEAQAEGRQAKTVEKVRIECDALKATASEQRAAIDGRIDEQNAAVSTAIATLTKQTEAATEELRAFIATSFETARTELESACSAVAQELRSDLETVSAQHRKNSAESIASIADVSRRLDERVCPHLGRVDELLAEVQARVTQDASNADRRLIALSDRSDELRQFYGQLQEQEKALDKRVDGFVHEIRSEFLAHSSAIESWKNRATSDSSRILGHYEAIQREISSLKRIHHFTAQFEQYDHRFEEMVSYVQQYLRSSFRSIYASIANGKTNGDSMKPPAKPRANRTQFDFFAIDAAELGAKADLGAILQRALGVHQAVSIAIPARSVIMWNRSIALLPNQAVSISGGRGSQIVMDGWTSVGDLADPSRVILDALCLLKITGLRIHATCDVAGAKPTLDLNALFVGRNDSAVGFNTIQIDNCQIETDIPVVNVGGNSATHVSFADSAIRSSAKGRAVVYPVTAEFGVCARGFGSVTRRNVTIVPPIVQWLVCDALSHDVDPSA